MGFEFSTGGGEESSGPTFYDQDTEPAEPNPGDSWVRDKHINTVPITWRDGDVPDIRSFMDDDEESIYMGDNNGTAYSINKESGIIEWSTDTNCPWFRSGVTVGRDNVYIGGGNSPAYIFALDKDSGAQQWQNTYSGLSKVRFSNILLDYENSRIYHSAGDTISDIGEVYANQISDGTEDWRYTYDGTDTDARGEIVQDKNSVYAPFLHYTVSLSKADGTEEWNYQWGPGDNRSTGTAIGNNTLYWGDMEGPTAYAVDLDTGAEVWTKELDGYEVSQSIILRKDRLYLATWTDIYMLDSTDGTVIESTGEINSMSEGKWGLDRDNSNIFVLERGAIGKYSLEDLELQWKHEPENIGTTIRTHAFYTDGMVLYYDRNLNALVALKDIDSTPICQHRVYDGDRWLRTGSME